MGQPIKRVPKSPLLKQWVKLGEGSECVGSVVSGK